MANEIRLKRGSGSDPSASDLVTGEIAVRTDNGKLFTKKDDGSVAEISGGGISDGDKGDITVSNSGATFTIDNGVVNGPKIATGSISHTKLAQNAVETDNIADGTILNADINASAAIAGSKISPDFGSQNITTTGDITANGGDITISGTSPILHLVDTNDNPNYRVQNVNGVFQIYDATSDVSRFNVATNGLVSVPADFDVNGTLSVTSTAPQIELVDSNANSDFRLKCNSGSFHIEDITNAGNRLSIDSSGDVIIHNDLDFPDSSKIKFGASDDLTITHDGSHSRISDTGTGSIKIETDSAVHINKGTSENMAKFIVDGQVELYFDNSKKLSTASDGITVTGRIVADELDMGDNDKVKLGTGDDFELFHDGSHARIDNSTGYITLDSAFGHILRNGDGSETLLRADVNGSVELYENGTKRIETTDTGATITGNAIIDSVKIGAWSGGSTYKGIFHSSQSSSEYMMINNDGHTFISATGSHNVYIRNGANDSTNQLIVASGSDGLTWRGNKVFHAGNDGSGSGLDADSVDGIAGSSLLRSDAADTASGDITFSGGAGAATIAANSDIRFTDGDWTGNTTSPKIQAHSNYLYIAGGSGGIIFRENATDRWHIEGSGHFIPKADSTYDIGTNSTRVANGYFDTLYGDGSNLTNLPSASVSSDSDNNTVAGTNAGDSITNATDNTFFGFNAGTAVTSSGRNTAFGSNALPAGTGTDNSCFGHQAGKTISTGTMNTCIGRRAGESITNEQGNTVVGFMADSEGDYNVILGQQAGENSTGGNNVIIGVFAGQDVTGASNHFIGYQSAKDATSSTENVCIGRGSAKDLSTGSKNVIIGQDSANSGTNNLTGGDNNIIIGHDAAASSATIDNEITLGDGNITKFRIPGLLFEIGADGVNIGANSSSNPFDYLRFGASQFGAADIAPSDDGSHTVGLSFRTDSTADTTINPTEAMRISANGNIGAPNGSNIYSASDSRLKQNVTTLDKGLSAINSLRPVSFNWVDGFCDEEKNTLYGFIAQEVQTIDSNLISQFAPNRSITIGETTIENALTVNEKFIIPMLVKAVQELTARITTLESS